jgi:hypothetical protein
MGESGTKLPPGDARLMARWGFEGPGDTNDTNDSSFAVLSGDRKDWDKDGDGDGDGERRVVVFLLHPQLGIRWVGVG